MDDGEDPVVVSGQRHDSGDSSPRDCKDRVDIPRASSESLPSQSNDPDEDVQDEDDRKTEE